ncbi:MAG: flagellar assembly protein T N-terminal domain-containing protein [Candidatus Delongbacteria bacterium]
MRASHSTHPAGLRWLLTLLLIVLGLSAGGARAQESATVTVEGLAQIIDGNTLSAREAALRDAMRKAVETALGTLMESRTMVENFELKKDEIYSRASGFVSTYEVLEEKKQIDMYWMKVRAVVNQQKLGDDARALGLLQELVGKPKMMIMVDEYWWDGSLAKDQQEAVDDPASAARIAERFLGRGFALVDAETVKKLRSSEMQTMDDLMNNGEAIIRLAQQAAAEYGAEVLILGTCKAEPANLVGGKYTATATFTAKIVDASTGALLGTKQYSQSGVGISPEQARSESGARAGDGVSQTLIDQVLQYWQDKANNGMDYVIKLYNVDSFVQQGMKFITGLKGIGGVTHAKKRSWDEKLHRLEIDLTYKGNDVDELTYAIVEALSPAFPQLDLREAKGNNLNFYLKK